MASLKRSELPVELRVRERVPVVLEALARPLARPANLWQAAAGGTVRHPQFGHAAAAGVLGEPVLQGLAVHLLVLPGHGVDGGLRALQALQHVLVLVCDAVQLPALRGAVQASRNSLGALALEGELRRLGVDVQHLLQQDAILELNLGGPVFLQLPRLRLRDHVWVLRRPPRVNHAPRVLEGTDVFFVAILLDAVSHHPVAWGHVPDIAFEGRHGPRCARGR
mmetsp:Transcript_70194/g.183968  ORF Transcript_70194/g.183968 Transcript_70194/m.183968 type:complete len:222 (+) Transcript_70194:136-801(+)